MTPLRPTHPLGRAAGLGRRVLAWPDALLDAYLPRLRRHRPAVRVEIGPWLPGWLLRPALAGLVLALAGPFDPGIVVWGVLVLLGVLVALRPAGLPAGIAAVVVSLLASTAGRPPSGWMLAALVAGLPTLLQLGAVLGRAGWAARIELAALVAVLPRFCAIQAIVQPLALFAALVSGQQLVAGSSWVVLPLAAVLGVGVLSYGWLPRLGRADD